MNKNLKPTKWFVLNADKKYGPFSHFEMMGMIVRGEITHQNYVWTDELTDWHLLSECPEFSHDEIEKFKKSPDIGVDRLFNKRKYPRILYGSSVVIHDQFKVWKAHAFEIGAGGAGLLVCIDANFELNKELFLHFKPADGVPPFNALCRVVSKRNEENNQGWLYGVEFKVISKEIKNAIFDFTKKSA